MMFLEKKRPCPPTALFDVPHKKEPVTAAYLMKKFPKFASEMNGTSDDCCLLYFWKRNKETKVYEFIDEEAEEEVAEMLGVSLYNEEEEAEKAKQKYLEETRALTEEEIRNFKEELAYASQQMKEFLSSTTKTSAASPPQQQDATQPESNEVSKVGT